MKSILTCSGGDLYAKLIGRFMELLQQRQVAMKGRKLPDVIGLDQIPIIRYQGGLYGCLLFAAKPEVIS